MDKSEVGSGASGQIKSGQAGVTQGQRGAAAAARPADTPGETTAAPSKAAATLAAQPQMIRVLRNVRQAGEGAAPVQAQVLVPQSGAAQSGAPQQAPAVPAGAAPASGAQDAGTKATGSKDTPAQSAAAPAQSASAASDAPPEPSAAQNAAAQNPSSQSSAAKNPAAEQTAAPAPAQRPGPPRWRFFRAVSALILREMATRYGRTPGGYLWALLEPIGGIVVLSLMFSLIARNPALGTNFMLFFATGMLSFQLYLIVANLVGAAIQFSRPLLGYPAMTLMDALIARLLLNTLTQIFTGGIILTGIIYFYDLQPVLRWGPIFLSMAMALSLAIGVGAVNAVLFTVAPVWQQFWGIFGRAQLLLSGVLFIPEMAPAHFRSILMWNPVSHVTSEMRKGFYASYDAVYVDPVYVFSVALVLGVFGMLFLIRFHKDIVLR